MANDNDPARKQSAGRAKRYANNPLIEKLPPEVISQENLEALLSYLPTAPSASDRSNSARERLFECEEIKNLQVCLERDLELEVELATVIREGYRDRYPNAQYWRNHNDEVRRILENAKATNPDVAEVRSIALTGISGGGKSRTVGKVLRMYPQLVEHDTSKNSLLPLKQVVWMKLDYPSNRSMGGFCRRFFAELGRIVGEDYTRKFGNGSIDEMISDVGSLARQHFLGILIIDEIQHAVGKSGRAAEALLRHLISLANELKMPVMFIGTPKASRELRSRLASARRLIGRDFERMRIGDTNWVLLVSQIWDYQYTSEFYEIDDVIFDKLYELTQGIPLLLTNLWVLTQRKIIFSSLRSGEPEGGVTVGLLQEVYNDYFAAVNPIIQAIKLGDQTLIDYFEDVAANFKIEELIAVQNRAYAKEFARLENTIKSSGRKLRGKVKAEFQHFLGKVGGPTAAAGSDELAARVRKAILAGKDPNEAMKALGVIKGA